MICAATKGFLTLGDCGAPASSVCSQCSRPMCVAHLSPTTGFSTCYGCAASQPAQQRQPGEDGEYDESWAHGYRSAYYSDTGYRPSQRSGYTSDDSRSFDERHGDGFDEDHEPGGFEAS